MNYCYDRIGRLTHIELPDHTGIAYTYDAVHLKTVKRLSEASYEHNYIKYDLSSNLLEEQTPCGQVTYEWDPLDQAKAIRSSHFTEEIGSYDPVGNLLQKNRQRHTNCKYTYDALDQLQTESVTGFSKHEYLYDSLNNRRKLDGEEHTVNHLNQLLSHGNTSYTYDAKGHLIAEESPTTNAQYTYDALGRLTSLASNGETYQYQYDAFNRRTKKITPDGEERYLYIDQNEIGMVNSCNEIVQLRILGSGKGAEIGSAIALELEGQTYVPIHDHAGNVSVLVDLQTQKTAESYTYSAFGETKREGTPVPNPWFFSSKRFDPESGWIFFGRRYYDPNTGRWTTPDPLGFADGPNLYAYVHNNPLTHFDLYGLASVPGPASGSSGTASGGSRGISSGSSRSTSGHYRDSNSGSGSSKWDGGRREEHRCGAHAGVHVSTRSSSNRSPGVHASVYSACNSIPGVGLDGAAGYRVTDCFCGSECEEGADTFWMGSGHDFCNITIQTNLSSDSAFLDSFAQTGQEVVVTYFFGRITLGAGNLAWKFGGRQIITAAWAATGLQGFLGGVVQKVSHIAFKISNELLKYVFGPKTINRGSSFAGRKYAQLKCAPYQLKRNPSSVILGRKYSGHALDRMQDRGITPSMVENTILNGNLSSGRSGTLIYHDAVNNITVITNTDGSVITTYWKTL